MDFLLNSSLMKSNNSTVKPQTGAETSSASESAPVERLAKCWTCGRKYTRATGKSNSMQKICQTCSESSHRKQLEEAEEAARRAREPRQLGPVERYLVDKGHEVFNFIVKYTFHSLLVYVAVLIFFNYIFSKN